ncbi:MAG TPA: TetR/AcrR family transcriptional regulator [Chloroflexota bacterium]|nr:TetR/AcrR family transcriptional regulator [Chloroflexota bacterium]
MTPTMIDQETGRTARKRTAIIEAATELFLMQGYEGTSMDQVAAQAAVSKQTVYKQFADKDSLFAEVILGLSGTAEAFIDAVSELLGNPKDLERALKQLARRYLQTLMQPRVLQLRRLLIGQAGRFPELGATYYERVPERTVTAIATCFEQLSARGLLRVPDAILAARQFAVLVLFIPLDKALICGDNARPSASALDRLADAGVDVFLAAYSSRG